MRFDHTKQIIFRLVIIAAIATVCDQTTQAQSGTASVSGTVFDQQRRVISGASAELSNAEKAFTRTVQTNTNGTFSFPAIPPGIYRLEVEMNGFKKFVRKFAPLLTRRRKFPLFWKSETSTKPSM